MQHRTLARLSLHMTPARIMLFSTIGMTFNIAPLFQGSFPVLMTTIASDLGSTRTGVTLGYAVMVSSLAIAAPFFGRLLDRYGPRRLLIFTIPALCASISLFAVIPAKLPAFIAVCAFVGAAGAGSFQFVYFGVIPRWFDRQLGLAFGIAGSGLSVGIALFAVYSEWLLKTVGWRHTYIFLALTALVITLPNLLLLREKPDWSARYSKAINSTVAAEDGVPFTEVLKSSRFWRLAMSYLFLCAMINGDTIHLIAMLTDRGMDAAVAARSMVYLGVANLVARIGCGALLVRANPARLGSAVFLLGTFGAVIVMRATTDWQILFAVVLLGSALGAEAEMMNFMARRLFGLRALGTVLGALNTAFLTGVLLGPLLLSICHDLRGNYIMSQVGLIAAGSLAVVLHFSIKVPRRPRISGTAPFGALNYEPP